MGILRFTLAMAVLFSHLGWNINGFNPGVTAVVIFYLLAGYVVDRLLVTARRQGKYIYEFYADRLWRLLPAYMSALLFSAAVWFFFRPVSYFASTDPNVFAWLSNILVVPLNYYMYSGIDRFTLLPPAWSLGTEIQFYLIAPLIFSLSPRLFNAAYALSVAFWLVAQTHLMDTDHFGYRLLPGVLFIFMTGMLMARLRDASRTVPCTTLPGIKVLWLIILAYTLSLWLTGTHTPHDREVAIGLLLALTILLATRKGKAPVGEPRWSRNLGHYAYGVFLLHFPVLWLQQQWLPDTNLTAVIVPTASLMLAMIIHHAIERPCWRKMRTNWGITKADLAKGP